MAHVKPADLTDADIARAKENDIPTELVHARLYQKWSIERATTQKVQVKVTNKAKDKWRDLADANDIPREIYRSRIQQGWTPERAATHKYELYTQGVETARKITPEVRKQAIKRGILVDVLLHRVFVHGWDPREAAVFPMTEQEKELTPQDMGAIQQGNQCLYKEEP